MTTVIIAASAIDTLHDCCTSSSSSQPVLTRMARIPLEDCRSSSPLQDCRSPLPDTPLPDALLRSLRPHPLLQMLPLDEEYAVVFVPSGSQVAVLDRVARALLGRLPLADQPSDELTIAHVLKLYALGLVTAGDGTLVTPPEPDVLVAWLHITNACNLRCRYCYLHKTNESMSEETARAAIDAVIRSALAYGYRKIALKYAGGEASLQMPLIELIHTYAVEQTIAYGLQCQAGLLSNGTGLTRQKLNIIRWLGLQLMISLDGMAEAHDAQRPTSNGRGSFTAALNGIDLAIDADIIPHIAVTVTGANIAGLPALVTWLLERELPFTTSFYRVNDCSSSFAQLQLDEQRLISGMRETYAAIERNPPPWSILGSLLDRADLSVPHRRTCAVGENYLVIDHHGRIAKCQMAIDQPITSITVANPLSLIRADQIGIQNLPVDQKEGCRSCEWRYWCTGGCPAATYRATGRYDIQSPNCGIYKALYPDLLRLEGRRLLYWHRRADSIIG